MKIALLALLSLFFSVCVPAHAGDADGIQLMRLQIEGSKLQAAFSETPALKPTDVDNQIVNLLELEAKLIDSDDSFQAQIKTAVADIVHDYSDPKNKAAIDAHQITLDAVLGWNRLVVEVTENGIQVTAKIVNNYAYDFSRLPTLKSYRLSSTFKNLPGSGATLRPVLIELGGTAIGDLVANPDKIKLGLFEDSLNKDLADASNLVADPTMAKNISDAFATLKTNFNIAKNANKASNASESKLANATLIDIIQGNTGILLSVLIVQDWNYPKSVPKYFTEVGADYDDYQVDVDRPKANITRPQRVDADR